MLGSLQVVNKHSLPPAPPIAPASGGLGAVEDLGMGLAGPGGAQSPGADISPSVRIHGGLLIQVEVHTEKGARCAFCAGFVGIIV